MKNILKFDFDVVTLGEILLRFCPGGNRRIVDSTIFESTIGGAEFNVAAALANLELKTAIITKLPFSSLGELGKKSIRTNNVATKFVTYDNSENSRMGIYFKQDGAHPRIPEIVYDRQNTSFSRMKRISEFENLSSCQCKIFHTTGISLAIIPEFTKECIKMFSKNGAKISFDVNYRANLWEGKEELRKRDILEILKYIDIFFCSEESLRKTFYPDYNKGKTLKELQEKFANEYGIEIICSTKRIVKSPKIHDFSSLVFSNGISYKGEEYHNIDIVDRVGSGDAYIAGMLYGLLKYNWKIKKAQMYANALSVYKNTIPGDILDVAISKIEQIIKYNSGDSSTPEMVR